MKPAHAKHHQESSAKPAAKLKGKLVVKPISMVAEPPAQFGLPSMQKVKCSVSAVALASGNVFHPGFAHPTQFTTVAATVSITETLERIRNGIPLSEFDDLTARLGLTQEELAKKIGISVPTLSRRKKNESPLDPEHSDRLMRFQRLFAKATALFDGNEADARDWLNREEPALGYFKPVDLAETEAGAREVENVLGRLEFGELT